MTATRERMRAERQEVLIPLSCMDVLADLLRVAINLRGSGEMTAPLYEGHRLILTKRSDGLTIAHERLVPAHEPLVFEDDELDDEE